MTSSWFDLNPTLTNLNLSFLRFFEWFSFQNHVCKYQCHRQSLPTWCHRSYLVPQDIVFAWIYVTGITNQGENYGEKSQLFFSLFLVKEVYGKMVFFFFPNLVGFFWSWLLRVGVVWLLTINAWMFLGNGSWMFLGFDKLVVSWSLCVCVFFNYFTLCYWNNWYIVGIAYIHQL